MLASSGKSDCEAETDVVTDFSCGPARGMAFVRCAHVPVASRKDFSFLDLPACFFRSREVKKLLGPLGPKPSRSDGFPFLEVSLWHTQLTRRRDGQRFL
jgi:hypothetical protein